MIPLPTEKILKAQWFTPSSCLFTCLKKNERSLSFKYPKDDPTKPSLRRNIPKDTSLEDYHGIVSEIRGQEFPERRPKSLIARSKNSSTAVFGKVLLGKSESDHNIPRLSKKEYFEKSENEPKVRTFQVSRELSTQGTDGEVLEYILSSDKRKCNENSDWFLEEYSKLEGNNPPAEDSKGPLDAKKTADSNHKVVHIIIDFPQKVDENLLSIEQSHDFSVPQESRNSENRLPEIKLPKKWRSRSLPSESTMSHRRRFEVHEIEDSGTYVLHLKFKNAKQVEVVPEKEVSTRTPDFQDFSPLGTFRKPIQKGSNDSRASEGTREVVKYLEKKKKKSKRAMKSKSQPVTATESAVKDNVQASEFLDWQQPQYYELPVSDSFEEKKILKSFQRDDFGTIKSASNRPVFKIPSPVKEVKPEEMSPEEVPPEKVSLEKVSPEEVSLEKVSPEEVSPEEVSPTENTTVESEVKAEAEPATVQREPVENENVEGAVMKAAEPQTESQANDNDFAAYSYTNPSEYSEATESLPVENKRLDWKTHKKFVPPTPVHQLEPETEDTIQPVKKFQNPDSRNEGSKKNYKTPFKSNYNASKHGRHEPGAVDFKNGALSVSIRSEKPTYAMKLSAAHPPLLNETMKKRYYRFGNNSAYNGKTMMNLFSKEFELNHKCLNVVSTKLSKSDSSLDVNKTTTIPKISDNICNIANENITQDKGTASLDSLAMMKKVKEIVDLDLNNAIKIFTPESSGVVNSVVIFKGNKYWIVDEKELSKCLMIQKSEFLNDIKKAESVRDSVGEKGLNLPKLLPTTKEGQVEMKLESSVVTFNPDTNKFIVDTEDLQEAIKRRTEESFDDVVVERLEGLLTGSKTEPILVFDALSNAKKKLKSGDSILVFDEDTQKWKVDYSILEKKEEQKRVEKELTKRSELILETIEKIENRNIPSVPIPDTRGKKTFDYNKEEWKDYAAEKKSKSKSKFPFKKSDAKEIRKKNSDLFEDLFVKRGTSRKSGSLKSNEMKLSQKKETGATKETGVPPTNPEMIPKEPEPINQQTPAAPEKPQEDDNYWESFLNMVITPKNNKKTNVTNTRGPKIRAPSPPPTTPPAPPKPPVSPPTGPKIEEPKLKVDIPLVEDVIKKKEDQKIPPKKPEVEKEKPKAKEPASSSVNEKSKVRSWIPFSKKSKIPEAPLKKKDEPKVKPQTVSQKEDVKPTEKSQKDEPKVKPPAPPPPSKKEEPKTAEKSQKDEPKVKPPVPAPPPSKKEEPKTAETSQKDKPKGKPQSPPDWLIPKKGDSKPPKKGAKEESKDKVTPIKEDKSIPPASVPQESPKPGVKNVSQSEIKAPAPPHVKPKEDPKTGGTKDKSAADHYISENIVELSRNSKDKNTKMKPNKIETVKLNITPDKRLPTKVTEINLNKQSESAKESTLPPKKEKNIENGIESRIFYKKFDKYKTPFSDPEYEEKSMRIKSDVASNPNLKKLGSGNKTLVLHDVAKSPENMERWLQDETDKMATLLLKVLQEAADGKPRRKSSRTKLTEKSQTKANPYDNIRKKQENATQESFLFKIRSMNLSTEGDKNTTDQGKSNQTLFHQEKPATLPEAKEHAGKRNEKEKSSLSLASVFPEGKLRTLGFETTDSLISKDLRGLASEITDDIPGPQLLKRISGTWKFFPVLSAQVTIFTLLRVFQLVNVGKSFTDTGNLDKNRRHAFGKLFSKYGPIVNVQGPLSGSVILIHKPEHLSAVFEQDASIPVRSVFDSLEKIRREADEKIFPSGNPTKWDSSNWEELKKHSNDPLIKGREKCYSTVEAAGSSLIRSVRRKKNFQNCASDDFMDEIKRWSLEGLCNVLFEKSFGFLEGKNRSKEWILEPDKLLMAIEETTCYLSKCEKGFQTWRLMTTPSILKLKQSHQQLLGIIAKQLYQVEANLKQSSEALKDRAREQPKDLTFLESMLLNDGMIPEEIACNLADILVIGMNTMSSALGFLLYELSQNVKAQKKLVNEVRSALPDKNGKLSYQKFQSMKYLQACLKESLRLHIPVPIFHRQLQNDIMLANYIVPKGTYVVMDYKVSCMKEQVFDEAERFIPERWLQDEKWIENYHSFETLPVCHGPRAELAKRVMEMQILTCIAKIVRNFEVDYQFGELHETDDIFSFPDKPLKFAFVERDD